MIFHANEKWLIFFTEHEKGGIETSLWRVLILFINGSQFCFVTIPIIHLIYSTIKVCQMTALEAST